MFIFIYSSWAIEITNVKPINNPKCTQYVITYNYTLPHILFIKDSKCQIPEYAAVLAAVHCTYIHNIITSALRRHRWKITISVGKYFSDANNYREKYIFITAMVEAPVPHPPHSHTSFYSGQKKEK